MKVCRFRFADYTIQIARTYRVGFAFLYDQDADSKFVCLIQVFVEWCE